MHAPIPYPGAARAAGKGAVEKYQREESEAALAVAKKVLAAGKIDAKYAWSVGDVCEQIGDYVKKNKIDLIVMGSHGRGSLAALTLGSVAMKVLAAVKTPALIIR